MSSAVTQPIADLQPIQPVGPVSTPRPRGKRFGGAMLNHAVLILLAATTLAPFVWMVLASFKPLVEIERLNPIPTHWQSENYPQVFKQIRFARYYFNSLFVSAWVTFLQCLTSSMAAFAFSRLRWP